MAAVRTCLCLCQERAGKQSDGGQGDERDACSIVASSAEPRGRSAGVALGSAVSFAMRIPASTIANATAWAVLICLIAVAFVVVVILGPFGLIVLGLLTLFVCTSVTLREDAPT